MSFFNELKRRNVIRVAIAYSVAAWFLLQLADLVMEHIAAPGWVMQVVMLLLALGLPMAVIFAWAFEMTPEGIKREKDVDRSRSITTQTGRKLDRLIIVVLGVAVAYLLLDKFVLEKQALPPVQTAAEQTAAVKPEVAAQAAAKAAAEKVPSVAVLPFINMSQDKNNEYFSDGLTETLLHMLAQLPDLHVAARTSSFAFKGKNESITTIAKALGVAHVLEGSVQKAGDKVRITAQLIRADDGFHVWSQHYDRKLDDIFAIQDEIATDVAEALGASLLGKQTANLHAVATNNLGAYDDYLKGLEQQAIFSYGSLEMAENQFKQALAHDPDFTDARLALARNYLLKHRTGLIGTQEMSARVQPLLAQVREQHPDNHLARALELLSELPTLQPGAGAERFQAHIDELRNLLPSIPTETYIRGAVAQLLNFFSKQPRQAIEVLQAGLLVDPLAANLYSQLGLLYLDQKELDQASQSLQHALELAPKNPNIYNYMSELEKDRDNLPAALSWERKATEVDPQDHELATDIAEDLYKLDLPEEGDRWYARVRALAPDSPLQHKLEIERAVARKEYAEAITMAQAVIRKQQPDRRDSFNYPLFTYSYLMLNAGRGREAYDFLVSVRPGIADYTTLPGDFEGLAMQIASIELMTGFADVATRKKSWLQVTANMDANHLPWRDPEKTSFIDDLLIKGETQKAIDHYLEVRLQRPLARNLGLHRRHLYKSFYGPIYDDPRVAAKLAQLDKEFVQLRKDVAEELQKPEWNQ